jgi:site-specific recombinase XerD
LALFLPFASVRKKKPIERLEVADLSREVLRDFLDHLEQSRSCSVRTRNQRLAALHAMARFIAERSPEHIAWCGQVRSVPFKRFARKELSYLDKPEMDAVLAAPDLRTRLGVRDHTLLLFLYNSGARVTEATTLRIGDLALRPNQIGSVQLRGKGNKTRRCPLWPATCNELLALTRNRSPDEPVFLNRLGQPISRHGVHWMVRKYIRVVASSLPALANRSISPHTVRHTTATHLLRSGVDINTIRAWLGHVSIDTTNIYAEVDLQRKAEVLAHSNAFGTTATTHKHWKDDSSLIDFLRSL